MNAFLLISLLCIGAGKLCISIPLGGGELINNMGVAVSYV